MIELTFAFGALLGVDHIGLVLERDRRVGAFEFASTADGALGSDDLVGHALFSLQQRPGAEARIPTGGKSQFRRHRLSWTLAIQDRHLKTRAAIPVPPPKPLIYREEP